MLRVALAQLRATASKQANIDDAVAAIRTAAAGGAKIVALPV